MFEVLGQATPRIIAPTVGRVLWFRLNGGTWGTKINVIDPAQACTADVLFVHSDRMVNVSVQDHTGTRHLIQSCQLRQPDDDVPPEGVFYCEWMPYQQGQAAKTEKSGAGSPDGSGSASQS